MRHLIKRKAKFCVYILQCRDGAYYTGFTSNLERRLKLHDSGQGAKYLRGKGPLKVVYVKAYTYYKNALHAERNIKKLARKQKEEMVKSYAKSKD